MFCRGFAYLAGIYFNFTITFSDLSGLRNPKKLMGASLSVTVCDFIFPKKCKLFHVFRSLFLCLCTQQKLQLKLCSFKHIHCKRFWPLSIECFLLIDLHFIFECLSTCCSATASAKVSFQKCKMLHILAFDNWYLVFVLVFLAVQRVQVPGELLSKLSHIYRYFVTVPVKNSSCGNWWLFPFSVDVQLL